MLVHNATCFEKEKTRTSAGEKGGQKEVIGVQIMLRIRKEDVCEALGKCHTKTMQQRRVHKMEPLKEECAGGTGHIAINDESTVRILPNRSTFHSFSIVQLPSPL